MSEQMLSDAAASPEQLLDNWNEFLSIIETEIESPRKEQLLKMYEHFSERLITMPASTRESHHNCFPGGYIQHVLNVVRNAIAINDMWESAGATINHTRQELIFSAINHDLGKVGTTNEECYIPNPSEWHVRNQGAIYTHNPNNSFAIVSDRSLFLLQEWGIKYSNNEFLGIKLHDGMYEDANKAYYLSHSDDSKLRCNLPYILHQADMMAARIEYEMWKSKQSSNTAVAQIKSNKRLTNKVAVSSASKRKLQSLFAETFNV